MLKEKREKKKVKANKREEKSKRKKREKKKVKANRCSDHVGGHANNHIYSQEKTN